MPTLFIKKGDERVPIKIPDGWRALQKGEIMELGDHYIHLSGFRNGSDNIDNWRAATGNFGEKLGIVGFGGHEWNPRIRKI